MADSNFLSSLLNYQSVLDKHYAPDTPQSGQSMLGNIYSTIDSAKRKVSDFVQNPVESTRQFISNQNEDSGKQLGLLSQSFTGADGKPTIGPQTPQAQAAHSELSNNMTAAMMGATVWHASPHKFNAFDSSKIGTGEGVQAYGHGIYAADSQDVAKPFMRDQRGVSAGSMAEKYMKNYGDQNKAAAAMDQRVSQVKTDFSPEFVKPYEDALSMIKSGNIENGHMYKVDLPDEHIAKMLDWDKPLSAQHPDVQKVFAKTPLPLETTGEKAYQWLSQIGGGTKNKADKFASGHLLENGIPGIRYLDGGSRATGGTSNYVVFPGNEHMLSIQERNSVPLSSMLKP